VRVVRSSQALCSSHHASLLQFDAGSQWSAEILHIPRAAQFPNSHCPSSTAVKYWKRPDACQVAIYPAVADLICMLLEVLETLDISESLIFRFARDLLVRRKPVTLFLTITSFTLGWMIKVL
jgi:hypothetical protein